MGGEYEMYRFGMGNGRPDPVFLTIQQSQRELVRGFGSLKP